MIKRELIFDKQENAKRNRAFAHGFWVLALLVAAEHFLTLFEVDLPFGTGFGMLYVAIAGSVVTLELIISGVYMPKYVAPKFVLVILVLAALFAGARLAMMIHSHVVDAQLEVAPILVPFLDPLGAERRVESIIFFSLLLLVFVCGTIRTAYDMRKKEKLKGGTQCH